MSGHNLKVFFVYGIIVTMGYCFGGMHGIGYSLIPILLINLF